MTHPTQHRLFLAISVAAILMLAAFSPPTAAAGKRITGKLSKPGYTVIALAKNGEAKTDRAPEGKFKLRPPAKKTTLHLRASDGTYAGPIVLGKQDQGKRAIVGINAGAGLGKVKVKPAKGYAKPTKKVARKWVDAERTARAKNGIPIGAGNFGLVKSRKAKGGVPGDRDLDGVPATLDIDDDGDLILDDYDRSSKKRAFGAWVSRLANQPGVTWPNGSHINLSTSLGGGVGVRDGWAVNVNGGSTDEQIASQQQRLGALNVLWTGLDAGSGELDCGLLIYCSAGGTGRWLPPTLADPRDPRGSGLPFPECCDADGDGLGSLTGTLEFSDGNELMAISHGATPDQIKAGDVLIERGSANGRTQESAASVGFVFATHPVVAAFDDGQGNSGSFDYPPPEPCRSTPGACAKPVNAGPNGDLVLELEFWRPQRRGIEGEAEWMDVGNLAYAVGVVPTAGGEAWCPQSSYSATDPDLTPLAPGVPLPMFVQSETAFADLSGDRPSSPENTFANTLNLTDCYASLGLPPGGGPLKVFAAPVDSDPTSGPNAFAISEAQFRLEP